MKFEKEVEQLLQGSVADIDFAAIEGSKAELESFRILQKQVRVQGQILLRLAAAIDGLGHEPS